MKRRIETTLKFNLERFDPQLGRMVGLETNILDKDKTPLRITEIKITSSNGGTEGNIYIKIDRDLEIYNANPIGVALHSLFDKWHIDRVTSGQSGFGPKFLSVCFELSRKENSFIEAAMWRAQVILHNLGIMNDQIPNPQITQRTFVWIPEKKAWNGELGLKKCGWVDFGEFLGAQYGLNVNQLIFKCK